MDRRNRWATTCASCGQRVRAGHGVYESRAGTTRVVHDECRAPRFGTAPQPRSRPYAEPTRVAPTHRLGATFAAHRKGVLVAVLVAFLVVSATAVVAESALSDEGRGGRIAIVEWQPPTTVPATTVPPASPSTADVTVAAAVEAVPLPLPVVTEAPPPPPPAPRRPRPTQPPPETTAPEPPPLTLAEAPATTEAPAVDPTTTVPPTTEPPTTAAPERRRDDDDCEGRRRSRNCDDDRRDDARRDNDRDEDRRDERRRRRGRDDD